MRKWLKARIESFLDNLIFTAILAGGVAVWSAVKSLPILKIIGISVAVFLTILLLMRLLSLKMKRQVIQIKEIYEDNAGECGLIIHNTGKNSLENCRAQLLELAFETPHDRWSLERYPKVEDLICNDVVAGFSDGKIPLFRWERVNKSLDIVYKNKIEHIGYGVANVPILLLLNIWAENTPATYVICKLEDRLGWGYQLSTLKSGLQKDKLKLITFQTKVPNN